MTELASIDYKHLGRTRDRSSAAFAATAETCARVETERCNQRILLFHTSLFRELAAMSSVSPPDYSFLEKSFTEAAIEVLGEKAAQRLPAYSLKRNPRLDHFLTLFERPTFTRRPRAPKGKKGMKICIECRVEKPKGDFNLADCKVCQSAREKAYRQTVWGSLMEKIKRARNHDKAKDAIMRAKGIKNFLDGKPIYPEYVGEFVKRQKGLCAYWNGSINFEDVRSWSIDRIDNNKGHLVGNVCIVDSRFQSADNSGLRAPGECEGSSQWSRQKFLLAAKLRQEPAPVPVYAEKPPIKRRRNRPRIRREGKPEVPRLREVLGIRILLFRPLPQLQGLPVYRGPSARRDPRCVSREKALGRDKDDHRTQREGRG